MPSELTGLEVFQLSSLQLTSIPGIKLPKDRRLGHLVEKVVSGGIKASPHFEMIAENIQLIEEKQTIGELDFLIRDKVTGEVIHLELAYKFYLYDPTISELEIENWIGPNRNDSLIEKLNKLKEKQFPLLFHPIINDRFPELNMESIEQNICLISNLYIPLKQNLNLSEVYLHFIKGFYYYFDEIKSILPAECQYYIPQKTEWGMDPSQNEKWITTTEFMNQLEIIITKGRSPLCWQKSGNEYAEFFVVSWQ